MQDSTPSRPTPLPNFFLAGAPKAGSTSLCYYLEQHPEIFMAPIKEPSHFASEIRTENFIDALQPQVLRDEQELGTYLNGPMTEKRLGGMVTEWDDYCRLFRNADGQRAIGEASVIYLWSKSAPGNIAGQIPDAKILLVLRDPAARAWSHYLHMVTSGHIRCSFRELIDADRNDRTRKLSFHHPFLELGLYGEQLRRYLDVFPRERMSIHLYEDYQADAPRMIAEVFNFLGVDPTFTPNTAERVRTPRVPKNIGAGYLLKKLGIWQAAKKLTPRGLLPAARKLVFRPRQQLQIDPADRRYLIDYYADDIRALARLLDRDLSSWLAR